MTQHNDTGAGHEMDEPVWDALYFLHRGGHRGSSRTALFRILTGRRHSTSSRSLSFSTSQ